jgi:uncharacterized Tic20 family protein
MSDVTEVPENKPLNSDDTNWGVIAHLSPLAGLLVPFGSVIAPLIIMLTKGKDSTFVEAQARESLNFQITIAIGIIASFLLFFVLIGFAIMPILIVADFVLIFLAAVAASKGENYQYPFTLRLIK